MDFQSIVRKHLINRTYVSYLLYPLSFIYTVFVVFKRQIYRILPFLSYKSKIKIITVGNITTGGTGKTPVTIYIAKCLQNRGLKVAIVLRGYRGKFENRNILISDFNSVFNYANSAGDEAYLYTQKLPDTPVCVGKKRIKSIKILEKKFPELDYIIMDDAYQNFKIKPDISVCVLNSLNLFGNGFCLPAGILREPFSSINYADILILNGLNMPAISKKLYNKKYYIGNYEISKCLNKEKIMEISTLQSSKNILMSGIGLPQSFEQTVNKAGIPYINHIILNDHFNYNEDFIKLLTKKVKEEDIDFIIITEKDYSKLANSDLPFVVIKVDFKINSKNENNFLSELLA